MTREKAIAYGKDYYRDLITACCEIDEKHKEFVRMAIQALSQEPCDDMVSREAVIEWLENATYEDIIDAVGTELSFLPPVTQKSIVCDDAISRDAALEKMADYVASGYADSAEDFLGYSRIICQLPSVTQKSGWIPVSERLPEDEQEILFSTKTGRVQVGKYHDDDSANQWYSYRDKCRAWNNVVTAWMPLPTPFEPQESEE